MAANGPDVEREPNDRLRALLVETGFSRSGMARRVNVFGRARGMDLRYDKTSVWRWLQGQLPRGAVPQLIAEAFSGALGRKVTLDDIGMSGLPAAASTDDLQLGLTLCGAVGRACGLWRAEALGAGLTGPERGEAALLAALVETSRDWLVSVPGTSVARGGAHRLGKAESDRVWATVVALTDLDHRYGGGLARPLVTQYLNGVLAGLLRSSYPEETGRELYAAAARLSELSGYLAIDTDHVGSAQLHYTQALRFTQAIGDRGHGSHILAAGLGRLSIVLGHPQEALQLARAALQGAAPPVAARSSPYVVEARAWALLGDRHRCETAVGRAMQALGEGAAPQPRRGATGAAASLALEAALCHQDLDRPADAVQWARRGLELLPANRVRRRVLGTWCLATALVRCGQVRAGGEAAARAASLAGGVRSHQCTVALRGYVAAADSVAPGSVSDEIRALADDATALSGRT